MYIYIGFTVMTLTLLALLIKIKYIADQRWVENEELKGKIATVAGNYNKLQGEYRDLHRQSLSPIRHTVCDLCASSNRKNKPIEGDGFTRKLPIE